MILPDDKNPTVKSFRTFFFWTVLKRLWKFIDNLYIYAKFCLLILQIVWDEVKNKWVDKDSNDGDETNAPLAPPTDMELMGKEILIFFLFFDQWGLKNSYIFY